MAQSDDAGTPVHALKDSAAQLAEQQKKSGIRQLSGIAGAVHAAADELDEQLPGAAAYIHDAAVGALSSNNRQWSREARVRTH